MLTRLDVRGTPPAELRARLPRPSGASEPPAAAVRDILDAVEARGDAAVREFTERFDGIALDELRVPAAALDAALAETPPLLREALEAARASILAHHRDQLPEDSRTER